MTNELDREELEAIRDLTAAIAENLKTAVAAAKELGEALPGEDATREAGELLDNLTRSVDKATELDDVRPRD